MEMTPKEALALAALYMRGGYLVGDARELEPAAATLARLGPFVEAAMECARWRRRLPSLGSVPDKYDDAVSAFDDAYRALVGAPAPTEGPKP